MRVPRLFVLILAAGCGVLHPSPGSTPSGVVPRVGARALRHAIDSVVSSPEFANGHWGVLVVTIGLAIVGVVAYAFAPRYDGQVGEAPQAGTAEAAAPAVGPTP